MVKRKNKERRFMEGKVGWNTCKESYRNMNVCVEGRDSEGVRKETEGERGIN